VSTLFKRKVKVKHSPYRPIVWEIFARHSWLLIASFLCPLVWGGVGGYVIKSRSLPDPHPASRFLHSVEAVDFAIVILSLILATIPFALAESDDRSGFRSPPPRYFALPLTGKGIALCALWGGALTAGALNFLWVCFFSLWDIEIPILESTLAVMAAANCFQVILWALDAFPKVRGGALLAWFLLLIWKLPNFFEPDLSPDSELHVGPAIWLGGLVLATWISGAVILSRRRIGQRISLWGRKGGSQAGSLESFATPEKSQLWAELRGSAAGPLISLALGLAFILLSFPLLSIISEPPGVAFMSLLLIQCGSLFWAAMAGLELARDCGSGVLGLSPMVASRPVASDLLFSAKLKSTGLVSLAGITGLALTATVWKLYVRTISPSAWFDLGENPSVNAGETVFPIALGMIWLNVGALPVWMSTMLRSRGMALAVVFSGLIGAVAVSHFFLARYWAAVLPYLPKLLLVWLIIKFSSALFFLKRARAMDALSGKSVRLIWQLWLVTAGVFSAAFGSLPGPAANGDPLGRRGGGAPAAAPPIRAFHSVGAVPARGESGGPLETPGLGGFGFKKGAPVGLAPGSLGHFLRGGGRRQAWPEGTVKSARNTDITDVSTPLASQPRQCSKDSFGTGFG
jgi:hypothetical protein